MAERDTPRSETAVQLGQQLLEFVDKAEFGTVQFRAVSDYVNLQELYGFKKTYIQLLEGSVSNKVDTESMLRVQETKIVLLEHQIEQNKSQLPGYSGAYQHIETALEDINSLARVEAEKKYADIKDQDRYVMKIGDAAYKGTRGIVSMKKDIS